MIKKLLIICGLLFVPANTYALTENVSKKIESAEGFLDSYNQASKENNAAFFLGYLEIMYERPDLLQDKLKEFLLNHSRHTHFVPYTDNGFTKNFVSAYNFQKGLSPSLFKKSKIILTVYEHQLAKLDKIGQTEPEWLSDFDKILVLKSGEPGLANTTSLLYLELMKKTSETSSPVLFVAEGDRVAHEVLTKLAPDIHYHLGRKFPIELHSFLRFYPEIYSAKVSRYPEFSFAASEFALSQKISSSKIPEEVLKTTYYLRSRDNTFFGKGPLFSENTEGYKRKFSITNLKNDTELTQWLELLKSGGVFTRQKVIFKDKGWVDAVMTEDGIEVEWLGKDYKVAVENHPGYRSETLGTWDKNGHYVHNLYSPPPKKPYSTLPPITELHIRISTTPGSSTDELTKEVILHFDPNVAEMIAKQFSEVQLTSLESRYDAMVRFHNSILEMGESDLPAISKLLQRDFKDIEAVKIGLQEGIFLLDNKIFEETGASRKRTIDGKPYFIGFDSCAKFFEQ